MVDWVKPKAIMLAHTDTSAWGMELFLREVGARGREDKDDWFPEVEDEFQDQVGRSAGTLVETAGRLCYKSFGEGLNKNVTKTTQGTGKYIANVMKQGHGSLLEHVSVTFGFTGISRVVSHELVRHRAGCAYSQESGRYVLPDGVEMQEFGNSNDPLFKRLNELAAELHKETELVGDAIASEPCFPVKKKLTSDLRKFLPEGRTTSMVMTANLRAWRHIIALRTSKHAEEGIRELLLLVYQELKEKFPLFFQDASINDAGEVTFEWRC